MFWKLLLMIMRSIKCEKRKVGLCLYFKWTENGLLIWLLWIDDCLCVGHPVDMAKDREEILNKFECDDIGEVKEYVGCKIY